jgi:hypothetical protein
VPIVDAAIVYECQKSEEITVLMIQNALFVRGMHHNLIPPMMMRLAGLEVNECPKFLAQDPNEEHHSIYSRVNDLRINLQLEGIISYLPTCLPYESGLQSLPVLELTPLSSSWDPHNSQYKTQEEAMIYFRGDERGRSIESSLAFYCCTRSHEHT